MITFKGGCGYLWGCTDNSQKSIFKQITCNKAAFTMFYKNHLRTSILPLNELNWQGITVSCFQMNNTVWHTVQTILNCTTVPAIAHSYRLYGYFPFEYYTCFSQYSVHINRQYLK